MKKLIALAAFSITLNTDDAQWAVPSGANLANTNTGFVGIATSLYIPGGPFTLASVGNGSILVGQTQAMGVSITTPSNTPHQHYIKIDQANDRVLISSGNSDKGGGFFRGSNNSGETRIFSHGNYNDSQSFLTFYTLGAERARMLSNGNFGIGTASPAEKLSVNGKIRAHELKIEILGWPDYVFTPSYKMRSLGELEQYITLNKHLPEIPSAAEAEKNGIEVGEMNKLLLKKIEE